MNVRLSNQANLSIFKSIISLFPQINIYIICMSVCDIL